MNKKTTIWVIAGTAAIALIVGLCLGSCLGHGGMKNHRMEGGYMMRGDMRGDMHGGMAMPAAGMDGMAGMMKGMMMGLEGKTDDEFDKAFLSEMIMHHEGAVEMAQAALANAKHQEIKDLAKNIIAAQDKEIADMQKWQAAWYNK